METMATVSRDVTRVPCCYSRPGKSNNSNSIRRLVSGFLVLLSVINTKYNTVIAQLIGTDICGCQPATYTFTFDFDLICVDTTVEGPGINETACLTEVRGQEEVPPQDLVPVSVQNIQIFELDQNLQIVSQTVRSGTYMDGSTFTYTSIIATMTERLNPTSLPRGLQLVITGLNNREQSTVNTYIILYTNDCGIFPILTEGQNAGWTIFSDLGDPPNSICPLAPTFPPTASPTMAATTVSPTETPTVSPTETPTVSPTEEPTISPTEEPTSSPVEPGMPTRPPSTKRPTRSPVTEPPTTPEPTAATDSPTLSPATLAPVIPEPKPSCPPYGYASKGGYDSRGGYDSSKGGYSGSRRSSDRNRSKGKSGMYDSKTSKYRSIEKKKHIYGSMEKVDDDSRSGRHPRNLGVGIDRGDPDECPEYPSPSSKGGYSSGGGKGTSSSSSSKGKGKGSSSSKRSSKSKGSSSSSKRLMKKSRSSSMKMTMYRSKSKGGKGGKGDRDRSSPSSSTSRHRDSYRSYSSKGGYDSKSGYDYAIKYGNSNRT